MLDKEIIELVKQIKSGIMISTAESCTGGLLSAYLTSIAGSSKYFSSGIISYSNDSKIKLLSVKKQTLEQFGAVSEEVAKEMALGSKAATRSDVAIAITGIAGPSGAVRQKPVGTVCFAIATNDRLSSITHHLTGDRLEIRQQACKVALHLILEYLN